jgi:hypothetical protein
MKDVTLAFTLAVSLICTPSPGQAAEYFRVRAGETVVIAPGTRLAGYYNEFILEDGAKLVINKPAVEFRIGELRIGNNVQILGSGADGKHGADGLNDKAETSTGDGGYEGNWGIPGSSGRNGANVAFIAGTLRPIGANFHVDLTGGNGGNGGAGGQGGKGGQASCTERAGDGGTGGKGGDAGDGG